MNTVPKLPFEAGIYDPSHRRADTNSYWQWTNSARGNEWDRAAEMVNRGWPARCDFQDPSAKWYGVLPTEDNRFWIYRIYAGGKDRFGREGRYFFVILRMDSVEQVQNPEVAGLFRYFETERSLPLRTESLDEGWSGATPDEILTLVLQEFRQGRNVGHWGIDDGLDITTFQIESERPPARTPKNSFSQRVPRRPGTQRGAGRLPIISIASRSARIALGLWNRNYKIRIVCAFVIIILLGVSSWQKCKRVETQDPIEPPLLNPIPPTSMGIPPSHTPPGNETEYPEGTPRVSNRDASLQSEELPPTENNGTNSNKEPRRP